MHQAAATTNLALHWSAREGTKELPLAKRLPLMRLAVDAAPGRADLKLHLARALFRADRMAEILDRLRPMATDGDADAEILFYLGRAALTLGDYHLAADTLRLAARGGCEEAFTYLAEALLKLDRIDEAVEAGLRGVEHKTSDFKSLAVIVQVLVDRGETGRLWNLCADLRANGRWGGYLPAITAYAAAALGYDDEVVALIDPDKWFAATRLDVPNDFNSRLAAELLAHNSMATSHSSKAARGGATWIDRLDSVGGPLAQSLFDRIRAAVADYVAARQVLADHPIIAHWPTRVDLEGWTVALHDDGRQMKHIHPSGWISGVYYVAMPDIDTDDGEAPGAIEFGLMPFGRELKRAGIPYWRVQPQPGLLLLFPSYYAHSTRPTGVGDARICIAFDVTPSAL